MNKKTKLALKNAFAQIKKAGISGLEHIRKLKENQEKNQRERKPLFEM